MRGNGAAKSAPRGATWRLFCVREGAGFGIYFEPLSDGEPVPRRQRQAHLQQLAQAYARQLEAHCLRQPLQWFNFFDFWHLPQAQDKNPT